MPRTVLKERYESAPEEDEVAHDVSDLEHDDVGKGINFLPKLKLYIAAAIKIIDKVS